MLFDANGQQIVVSEANNPGGEYANPFEYPQSVVDGSNQTKWLDKAFESKSILWLHLEQPAHVVQYELITSHGDRQPWNWKRDPTSWMFGIYHPTGEEGEGARYEILSTVTDFDPPA